MLVRVYIKHVKLDIIYSICTQYGLPITALRNVKNCRATNRVIFNFISNSNFSSQPFINTRISRMLFASLSLKVYQNLILEFNLWFQYIHIQYYEMVQSSHSLRSAQWRNTHHVIHRIWRHEPTPPCRKIKSTLWGRKAQAVWTLQLRR